MKKVKRILILGAPGTGKNWLGEHISKKLDIPFYDTDDITWKKKYTKKRTHEEKSKILNQIIKKNAWIISSGARSYLGNTPKKATQIIILQEPIIKTVFRIIKRYVKRKIRKENDTLKETYKLIKDSHQIYHKPTGKINQFYQEIKKKYSKKTKILSKKKVKEYLAKFN